MPRLHGNTTFVSRKKEPRGGGPRGREEIFVEKHKPALAVRSTDYDMRARGQREIIFSASYSGEMKCDSGSVKINGSMAYVPQSAWILNKSVRENVTLGSEFDEGRYEEALKTSELIADLEILPAGDKTEIGEKGSIFPVVKNKGWLLPVQYMLIGTL